jgi:hypothetical protein
MVTHVPATYEVAAPVDEGIANPYLSVLGLSTDLVANFVERTVVRLPNLLEICWRYVGLATLTAMLKVERWQDSFLRILLRKDGRIGEPKLSARDEGSELSEVHIPPE